MIDDGTREHSVSPDHATSRQPSGRYESSSEHVSQLESRPKRSIIEKQRKQTPVHRPQTPDEAASKQFEPRPRSSCRSLPQSHADLFMSKSESRRGSNSSVPNMTSIIDEGYAAVQKQKLQTPLETQPLEKPSSKLDGTPTRMPVNRSEHAQKAAKAAEDRLQKQDKQPDSPAQSQSQSQSQRQTNPSEMQRENQRYDMFGGPTRRNSIDDLFVNDDEDEAVETPAMQEVHEQEEKETERKPASLFLGNSLLGPSRKPANATGSAPIAPMMHNSPAAKKVEPERRAQ